MESSPSHGAAIVRRIQSARRELLDLSARNRLISTPRGTSLGRRIEILGERAEEVFRLIVREHKAMSFLPSRDEGDDEGKRRAKARGQDQGEGVPVASPCEASGGPARLAQPEDDESGSSGGSGPRRNDLRLQTALGSEKLQARLLSIFYDAQTFEQEQGVRILYLAMGFLKWYESPSSDKERHAPLLLIPVDLERRSAVNRFHLRYRDEDVTTNLSLQAKMRAEFGIELPDVPDMDELAPGAYLDAVAQAVASQPRWEVVRDDMVLWFFSFAKYLMYRDLDPETWPVYAPLGAHPTLASLLGEGFHAEPPLCSEGDKIDALIPPASMIHVTDADSSQAIVIEEVRRGRHLVVQGPPGTGKSQTITNLIATAVKEGKKVLFVAEKMAALEVVHGRLERLGLGPVCLELHSHKAGKKAVLEQLARTLDQVRPAWRDAQALALDESLRASVERLNRHAEAMNSPLGPAELTPFQVIGRLAHLYRNGVEATNLTLSEPETWTAARFAERRRDIAELQKHIEELGPPADHPWRGVGRTEPILPADRGEVLAKIGDLIAALRTVLDAHGQMLKAFGLPPQAAPSMREAHQLAQMAYRISKAPPMDRQAIASPAWDSHRGEITELVTLGEAYAEGRSAMGDTAAEVAWQTDLATARRAIAGHGQSWFRWLSGDYRRALATLRGVLKGQVPRTFAERLRLVDEMIEVQSRGRQLDEDPSSTRLGCESFGSGWKGSKSNWSALGEIARWEASGRDSRSGWEPRKILARLERNDPCRRPMETIKDHLKLASARLQELTATLAIDMAEALGQSNPQALPIPALIDRLGLWRANPESLSRWIGYQMRRRRLEQTGLGSITTALHEGRIGPRGLVDLFEVAYYQGLIRDVFRRHSDLAEFDGQSFEQWIADFRDLDLAHIELARTRVARAHHDAIPRQSAGGEMAIIRREIEKKRKHRPIRQLIKEAGTAILAIKPVFLMSPISVAQFLEPGSVTFDLLLIDEASQVSPVDALGAICRARQVVVVGDEKQLPPTRFFSKMLDDGDGAGDLDDGVNAGDLESILGLCLAQGMSQRMLRWHYRSRHHSLIAVSNREFYDDRLHVVPSPTAVTAAHGLHFRPVEGGVFDRGNTATNRVEARAVAGAVFEHARAHPTKSLGVGTFSVAQRDAIRDELEVLQREHVDLAGFFAAGRPEPFFVKNLENIQGDERDVIFISVGYARDAGGSLAMNFGPLSSQGGERRLNVLISRARERCEVFSSLTAEDIDLNRARSRGAAAFKTFLRYAATGSLEASKPVSGDLDSDFEAQVADALRELGYEVRHRVGAAGLFIDLAVVDPEDPSRYLLGIECDGATYHAARWARDRDRLREAVCRDRGWKLHRVWSTDWLHRPDEQLRKIVTALEAARKAPGVDDSPADTPDDDHESPAITADTGSLTGPVVPGMSPDDEDPAWIVPYTEASIAVPSGTAIHDTRLTVLTRLVERVVEIEGPIHRDEVARRLTALWGQQRTGTRMAEAIARAIEEGIFRKRLVAEGDFLALRAQVVAPVRDRAEVASATLKRPEMLPPAELRQAILLLVAEHVGIRRDELPVRVARALGFKVMSPRLREAIEKPLGDLIALGQVVLRDEKLFRP